MSLILGIIINLITFYQLIFLRLQLRYMRVVLGTIDIQKPGDMYRPTHIYYHPNFNQNGLNQNDIALIKVDRDIQFKPSVNTICLPTANSKPFNKELVVIGFGKLGNGINSRYLQKVTLPIYPNNLCAHSYKFGIVPSQLCLRKYKKDSCNVS